jgi:hypothetical protein
MSDDLPAWIDLPALVRVNVSSVHVWRAFRTWNASRPWAEQVKPANFVVAAKVHESYEQFLPLRVPVGRCLPCKKQLTGAQTKWCNRECREHGARQDALRLVAPYESRPDRWESLPWRNLYDEHDQAYTIHTDRNRHNDVVEALLSTVGENGERRIRVLTLRDAMAAYFALPESKSAGPTGAPCGRSTAGLVRRRHVAARRVAFIGKESNRIEDQEDGWRAAGTCGQA